MASNEKAFQDYYEADAAVCYGCGRLNEKGLQIKSYWDGDESVCHFQPKPYHTAYPGYVYGGLIASLIDCHSTGTAAAAAYRDEGRPMESEPGLRFVTASLRVDYLKPTPIDTTLLVRAKVESIEGRRITISSQLFAGDEMTARGEAVCVRVPEHWGK
ncbi:MAG: PaaI family thioesterase [Chloroflexota bacterium]